MIGAKATGGGVPVEVSNEHQDTNASVKWFGNKHLIISGIEEIGTNDPANVA